MSRPKSVMIRDICCSYSILQRIDSAENASSWGVRPTLGASQAFCSYSERCISDAKTNFQHLKEITLQQVLIQQDNLPKETSCRLDQAST